MKKVLLIIMVLFMFGAFSGCSKKVISEDFIPLYVFNKEGESFTHDLNEEILLSYGVYTIYSFMDDIYTKEGIIEILYSKTFYDNDNDPYTLYKVKVNDKILKKYNDNKDKIILGIVF